MYLSEYINKLSSSGRVSFTFNQAKEDLKITQTTLLKAIEILRKKGIVFSPAKGLYIIVPSSYGEPHRFPMIYYIDQVMKYLEMPYYVGLLSAAALHGSSHQSPMILQIVTNVQRRSYQIGESKIVFYRKKTANISPIQKMNTPTGYINVSTPETTLFDLIQFYKSVGGLDHVSLVVSEMVEKFSRSGLSTTAKKTLLPYVQRGGYILDFFGEKELSDHLEKWLRQHKTIWHSLNPNIKKKSYSKNYRWKIYVNYDIEVEK